MVNFSYISNLEDATRKHVKTGQLTSVLSIIVLEGPPACHAGTAGRVRLGHVPRPQNFATGNQLPSEGFLANCHWQFSLTPPHGYRESESLNSPIQKATQDGFMNWRAQ